MASEAELKAACRNSFEECGQKKPNKRFDRDSNSKAINEYSGMRVGGTVIGSYVQKLPQRFPHNEQQSELDREIKQLK